MHQPRACSFPRPAKENGRPSRWKRGAGRKSALKGRSLPQQTATERHGTPGEGGEQPGVSAILAAAASP
jgi:hypothetical protein